MIEFKSGLCAHTWQRAELRVVAARAQFGETQAPLSDARVIGR
jgi:hypothetical protein